MPQSDARPRATARSLDRNAVESVLRRLASAHSAPWLHCEVARRMSERLSIVKLQPSEVLDWWGFLGGGGPVLAKAYPHARRVVVEPAALLQSHSDHAARLPWWSPRRWRGERVQVVAEADVAPGVAQLLWSNMSLHAACDPVAVMSRWHRAMAVDGFLMFSCFGPDTLKELRALYRRLAWPAPAASFVDMHDLGDMMVHAGFADPVMDQEQISLSWADPQAMLDELRTLGGNAAPDRAQGLRTPRWRARLVSELATLAGADGRPRMSFEIVYGHAFKPVPRARMDARTVVPLDDLRAMVHARRS
jgi:malonyl-CoA O-methyltransferase